MSPVKRKAVGSPVATMEQATCNDMRKKGGGKLIENAVVLKCESGVSQGRGRGITIQRKQCRANHHSV